MARAKGALHAAILVDTHISCPFLHNERTQDDRRCTVYQKIAENVRGCATCRNTDARTFALRERHNSQASAVRRFAGGVGERNMRHTPPSGPGNIPGRYR